MKQIARLWLLAALLPLSTVAAPRIATVDWTIGETLLALGTPPLAMGDLVSYRAWVEQPVMPSSVVDIGLRAQPNRELLAELAPDLILISPLAAPLEPTLSRIAPVRSIPIYDPQGDYWAQLRQATLTIATLVGRRPQGEALLAELEQHLTMLAGRVPATTPPLLLVQFIDERHVRVFGQHSLYQSLLGKLGLRNAWQGEVNYWGFAAIGIDQLAPLREAQLVVIEPVPLGVKERLAASALWQTLPLLRDHAPLHLPPVWSFGGVLSARRFADQLLLTLTGEGA